MLRFSQCVCDYNSDIMNNTSDLEDGMSAERIEKRATAYKANTSRISELNDFSQNIIIAGDGAQLFSDFAKDSNNVIIAAEPQRYQNACGVAICGEEKFFRGETVSANQLKPFYLRLPQAERELKAKTLKGE